MTIEIALLISLISLGFGIYSGIANMKRNNRADSQKDASEMAMVMAKLEHISNGIAEIKAELNNTKTEVKEQREKGIVLEQSLKSAWKRIEILEQEVRNLDG